MDKVREAGSTNPLTAVGAAEHLDQSGSSAPSYFAGGGNMRFWWATACISLLETVAIAEPPPIRTAEPAEQGVQIVTGTFGSLGQDRKLDIADRTQALCGRGATSCQVFCSETSYGRYALGRAPICRVTYRCGAGVVLSVEAAREEPILMRCRESPLSPQPSDGR